MCTLLRDKELLSFQLLVLALLHHFYCYSNCDVLQFCQISHIACVTHTIVSFHTPSHTQNRTILTFLFMSGVGVWTAFLQIEILESKCIRPLCCAPTSHLPLAGDPASILVHMLLLSHVPNCIDIHVDL